MYALLLGLVLQGDPSKDAVNIEGTWVVVSVEKNGEPYEDIKDRSFIFKGNKATSLKGEDEEKKAVFKLDPTQKPKWIDIQGEDEDKPTEGIYILEGNKLKICTADDRDGKRPSEFTAKKGSKQAIMVLKREKK